MMNIPAARFGATLLLAGSALAAAGIWQAAAADTQPVAIRFKAMVGDQPFACGRSYDGIGTTGSRITPSDFRFYVSDVELLGADGAAVPVALDQDGRWQYRSVALLDFEDKSGPCANGTAETRDVVTGTVPAGAYTGLRFTLGVPFELNHADATIAPSPLNLTSLFWNWQGGYKFVRIDLASAGNPAGAGYSQHQPGHIGQGYSIHLGSTGCASAGAIRPPEACDRPNRAVVTLPRFDPASGAVVADLKALLADSDVDANQPGTQLGCMSSPEDGDCAAILRNFGLPFGDAAAPGQSFFRAE